MATLAEMVERVVVKRDGYTLTCEDGYFGWIDNNDGIGNGFGCTDADASNAVLAELLRRLPKGWSFTRCHCCDARVVSDERWVKVAEDMTPLTALYAAYERFPELFAQPAKGGDGGEG